MILGKTLYDQQGNVLLPKGADLWPFVEHLKGFKIYFLYIDDELSKDIEAWDILSSHTRQYILELMRQAERVYRPITEPGKRIMANLAFDKISSMIAEDIFAQTELHLDMSELITNDIYTFEHQLNVAIVASLIGKMLDMNCVEIKAICLGALLHDVGLLALPEHIRTKLAASEPLTNFDFAEYKKYPQLGYDLIKHDASIPLNSKAAIMQHKECFDGSGFPKNTNSGDISQTARIVAIADIFDELLRGKGMASDKPLHIHQIIEYIQNHAGSAFDPELAKAFAKHAILFPNGIIVKLNDGRKGIVINQNLDAVARPIIRMTHDTNEIVNLLEDSSLVIEDIEL